MGSPSLRVSRWLHYGQQQLGALCAPWLHERQGVDLASGVRVTHSVRGKHTLTTRTVRKLVLAAPQREFRMQVIPLEATLSHSQLMDVLRSRGMVAEDTAIDVLAEPLEHVSIAVFSLALTQRKAWQVCYQASSSSVAAIEPDVHALWRYARCQHATDQAWLVAMPQQTTLYWPTAWPWGYHAEPLPAIGLGRDNLHAVLHTTVRRACLMTNNEAPREKALRLTGTSPLCDHWQISVDDIEWLAIEGPHPVAAGAAMKARRRWA